MKSLGNFPHAPILLGTLILAIFIAISFILRFHDFKTISGAQNLEATYHVLLTTTALDASPAKNHWYLPTVTLGKPLDKHTPWGATVPTKTGDYIYTSFTPAGFLAPHIWFNFLNTQPSVKNLAYFNAILGGVTAYIVFLLIFNLLHYISRDEWAAVRGGLVASTIAIFSREALQSQGIIYWSHRLYQPVLALSIYLIFKYAIETSSARQNFLRSAITLIAFIGPQIEWSGYILNLGLVYILWTTKFNLIQSKLLAVRILTVTIISGIITVIHFSIAVGFTTSISAFIGRYQARNTTFNSTVDLIQGYGLSYGLFLLIILIILIFSYVSTSKPQKTNHDHQLEAKEIINFMLIVAFLPLFENIIMLQHASQFSFDRLKFIFPASLILAITFSRFGRKIQIVFVVLILFASVNGYKTYKKDILNYAQWGTIDSSNRMLANEISDKADLYCSVLSSNLKVRAYANLLFNRSIYENKSINDSVALLEERNACSSIYLEGTLAFPDLPKYTKATITYKDGRTSIVDTRASE